jgi:RNA ligase
MYQLYQNLLNLTHNNDSFYYKDFIKDDNIYRIFNYRLASYTEFQEPGAIECRGIMFEVDSTGKYINIKSRPMAKFWNLHELEGHGLIDLSKVVRIMDKADGSLISSYVHNDKIFLKSKGSLESDQANDANIYLNDPKNIDLYKFIQILSKLNYTINLEWCSPNNRIVLVYDQPELKILNIRHNYTGEYLPLKNVCNPMITNFEKINKYIISDIDFGDPEVFIKSVPDMKDKIEGFVCEMNDGTLFKVKTLAYLALHHSKDSINSSRRLYEAVLEEASDDLKLMFDDDPSAIKLIEDMENLLKLN